MHFTSAKGKPSVESGKDWRSVLGRSIDIIGRVWPGMAGYTLGVWAVEFAVLLPVSLWVLNRLVVRSGELIVGNADLLAWLFSVEGVPYILLAGSLGLLGLALPVTGLFQIAAAAERGTVLTARETLGRVLPVPPKLLHFCIATFAVCLLCLLPLLGGMAVIATHDRTRRVLDNCGLPTWLLILSVSFCDFQL